MSGRPKVWPEVPADSPYADMHLLPDVAWYAEQGRLEREASSDSATSSEGLKPEEVPF